MKKNQRLYNVTEMVSSLVMVVTLLWLTISTPFVYAADQVQKQEIKAQAEDVCEDSNPFSNTTEEKNEGGVNTLSEYLHDLHVMDHGFTVLTKFYKCHPSDTYFAFHPDLLIPPPKA